jgi:hypothetical protein
VKQSRLHGVHRTTHDRGDLFAGIPKLIAQLHAEALLDRELLERLLQPVAQLLGTERLVTHEWQGLVPQVLFSPACRGTQRIARLAVGNSQNPRRGLGVAAEVARLAPHDPEGVVDDLFRQVVVVREARQEARHAAVVQVIQLFERLAVAVRDARHEVHLTRHRG